MPQLETSTYLSQFFWLITSFLTLWFFMAWFIIPKIEEVMEQRRRKIDDYVQKAEKINILIIEGFITILFQKQKKSSQNQK